jgi:hypothetical protein
MATATAKNNHLKWEPQNPVVERTIRLRSNCRAEILRVLQGMLNVLYYGEPLDCRVSTSLTIGNVEVSAPDTYCSMFPLQQKCQWVNMPEAVKALDRKVHPEYELQAAESQCFEAKFLIHVLDVDNYPAGNDGCFKYLARTPL